jgi:hypothetical protein
MALHSTKMLPPLLGNVNMHVTTVRDMYRHCECAWR